MFERHIISVHTEDPSGAGEASAATRERLKAGFAPGASRRMTLLGMMVGSLLRRVDPQPGDAVVYSSVFGESLSLENYLASFPVPSPTLFQSSLHPSAVQQSLIGRQRPVREFLPQAGGPELVLQSALAVMTGDSSRAIWCGGEECATWLVEHKAASPASFAFALELSDQRGASPVGRIALTPADGCGSLDLRQWFELVGGRRQWAGAVGSGWALELDWS